MRLIDKSGVKGGGVCDRLWLDWMVEVFLEVGVVAGVKR